MTRVDDRDETVLAFCVIRRDGLAATLEAILIARELVPVAEIVFEVDGLRRFGDMLVVALARAVRRACDERADSPPIASRAAALYAQGRLIFMWSFALLECEGGS